MNVIILNGKPFALGYMPIVSTSNYVHNFGCWIKSWLTSLANMSKDCHLKFQIWSRDVKIVRDWWKDSRFFLLLVRSHVHAFPTVLILSLERCDVTSKTTSHTKMHERCNGSHYITNRDIDHNKFIDVFSFEMSRCMHWWQGIVVEQCSLNPPRVYIWTCNFDQEWSISFFLSWETIMGVMKPHMDDNAFFFPSECERIYLRVDIYIILDFCKWSRSIKWWNHAGFMISLAWLHLSGLGGHMVLALSSVIFGKSHDKT